MIQPAAQSSREPVRLQSSGGGWLGSSHTCLSCCSICAAEMCLLFLGGIFSLVGKTKERKEGRKIRGEVGKDETLGRLSSQMALSCWVISFCFTVPCPSFPEPSQRDRSWNCGCVGKCARENVGVCASLQVSRHTLPGPSVNFLV